MNEERGRQVIPETGAPHRRERSCAEGHQARLGQVRSCWDTPSGGEIESRRDWATLQYEQPADLSGSLLATLCIHSETPGDTQVGGAASVCNTRVAVAKGQGEHYPQVSLLFPTCNIYSPPHTHTLGRTHSHKPFKSGSRGWRQENKKL